MATTGSNVWNAIFPPLTFNSKEEYLGQGLNLHNKQTLTLQKRTRL